MREFILSGRIVDAILVLMWIETGLIAWLHRRGRIDVPLTAIVINMLAGTALLLALRAALTALSPWWIAGFLGLALVCHVADLAARNVFTRRR